MSRAGYLAQFREAADHDLPGDRDDYDTDDENVLEETLAAAYRQRQQLIFELEALTTKTEAAFSSTFQRVRVALPISPSEISTWDSTQDETAEYTILERRYDFLSLWLRTCRLPKPRAIYPVSFAK